MQWSRRPWRSSFRRRMTPRFAAYRSRTAATACATSRSRPIASWRSRAPQPTRRIRRSRSSSCKPNMSPSRAPSWQPGGGARPPSRRSGRPIMRSSKARRSASRRSRPTEPGFSAGGAGSGGRSRFWMAGVCPIRSARSSTRCSCCGSVSGCRRARLWAHGISGDLPIVLLRINDVEDIGIARQLLRAHEYWRMKQLPVDLVILNERAASYVQDLQVALEAQLRVSQSRPQLGADEARGAVFLLRMDLVPEQTRARLAAVARVVLVGQRGSLADQLDPLHSHAAPAPRPPPSEPPVEAPAVDPASRELEFFNGLGGFAADGREYVILLGPGQSTPAPWINVVANPGFGFQVAADGGGFTWSLNSRENQLTPWSNDPVTDCPGEVLYLRDRKSVV